MKTTDSNFPMTVICPVCKAAITAHCSERVGPSHLGERFVKWFHFERIELAKERGISNALPQEGTSIHK